MSWLPCSMNVSKLTTLSTCLVAAEKRLYPMDIHSELYILLTGDHFLLELFRSHLLKLCKKLHKMIPKRNQSVLSLMVVEVEVALLLKLCDSRWMVPEMMLVLGGWIRWTSRITRISETLKQAVWKKRSKLWMQKNRQKLRAIMFKIRKVVVLPWREKAQKEIGGLVISKSHLFLLHQAQRTNSRRNTNNNSNHMV